MSDDPQERFGITADDLRRYDWQAHLAVCEIKEIHGYHTALLAGAQKAKETNDDLGCRVFSFLSVIASFHANYDAQGNPYGPIMTYTNGSRSLCAEDLTESDLAVLAGVVDEITDPEYQARVADILWTTKKNFKAAKVAVSAFLQSAERLKTHKYWSPFAERLERAAKISAVRGFEPEKALVLSALKSAVAQFETDSKYGLLCHRLISIILSLEEGDSGYSALSERLAQQFADLGNWHFAEDYWQLAERCHRRAGDETKAQLCRLKAAECNVSNGEAGLKGQGAMFAATWIGKGLESLRRAKAEKERIDAVHRRLLEVQACIPSEMRTTDFKPDEIPGFRETEAAYQEAARKFVAGHDLRKAVERLANISRPTDLKELQKQHAELSKEFIFSQLCGVSSIDHTGKTSDVLPPLGSGTPKEQADAQLKHLYNQARTIQWQTPVVWKIEPARQVIVEEHSIRRSELLFLVLNNPFIPRGHEGIYLQGLQAGFHGDWLVAMHLIIPQLETSIRHVLQQTGAITSGMRDGVQAEKDLKQLFDMPEFEKVFGADILFDLRGIMVERFGHNIRNEFAHGLLHEVGFYQPASVYLWWLTLHLCWRGFRLAHLKQQNA